MNTLRKHSKVIVAGLVGAAIAWVLRRRLDRNRFLRAAPAL